MEEVATSEKTGKETAKRFTGPSAAQQRTDLVDTAHCCALQRSARPKWPRCRVRRPRILIIQHGKEEGRKVGTGGTIGLQVGRWEPYWYVESIRRMAGASGVDEPNPLSSSFARYHCLLIPQEATSGSAEAPKRLKLHPRHIGRKPHHLPRSTRLLISSDSERELLDLGLAEVS